MKKLFLLAALSALFFTSCAVVPYGETKYILDFRQYTEQGFKISPAQTVNEPHDCLAIITLEAKSGMINISKNKEGAKDPDLIISEQDYVRFDPHKYKSPSPDEMLAKFVAYAKSLGANGISDFKSSVYRINGGKYAASQYVVTISGCAVNIKTGK